MADPLNSEEARQRFLAVTRGKRPADRSLDVATAKHRLRAADPGVDIGPTLRLVGERRWKPAALSLLPWLMSDAGRTYLAPLLLRMAEGFYTALNLVNRNFARRRTTSPPAAGGQPRHEPDSD